MNSVFTRKPITHHDDRGAAARSRKIEQPDRDRNVDAPRADDREEPDDEATTDREHGRERHAEREVHHEDDSDLSVCVSSVE